MMTCPICKKQIDDDSWYCDQCGEKIMMCPKCKEPRKGKRCSSCGSMLESAEELSKKPAQTKPVERESPVEPRNKYDASKEIDELIGKKGGSFNDMLLDDILNDFESDLNKLKQQPAPASTVRQDYGEAASAPAGPSQMILIEDPSKIVVFRDGAIIGRTQGDYVHIFGTMGYTSGRHAQLVNPGPGEWLIIDLNSTNGTKVNDQKLMPNQGVRLQTGQTVEIGFKKFRVQ